MTKVSLQELENFLKKYEKRLKLPIGNYGGGIYEEDEVRNLLSSMGIIHPTSGYRIFGRKPREGDKVKNLLSSIGLVHGYEVLDYCTGIDLMKPIKRNKYNLGICMDLLEHTTNPFVVAENIRNSLVKGALLFVTAPWVWEVHEFPVDHWRFTAEGLTTLFPEMEVIEARYVRDKHTDPEPLPRERIIAVFGKK